MAFKFSLIDYYFIVYYFGCKDSEKYSITSVL